MPCSYRSELPWLLALAGLLSACEHPALSSRYGNQTGASPGVYDAGDGTCAATCATPPGTILLYEGTAASNDELWAGLVGVWQICSHGYSIFPDAPGDTIGVEFAPPSTDDASTPRGNLFFLTDGPSGPVRGVGFPYQQTYSVSDGVLYGSLFYSDSYGLGLKYSPCPREWQVIDYYSGPERKVTLVPF